LAVLKLYKKIRNEEDASVSQHWTISTKGDSSDKILNVPKNIEEYSNELIDVIISMFTDLNPNGEIRKSSVDGAADIKPVQKTGIWHNYLYELRKSYKQ
jgi:hypothetical protein